MTLDEGRSVESRKRAHPLHELARLYGVQLSYHDVAGRRQRADVSALLMVLGALGAPVAGRRDVRSALRQGRQALWQRPVEPVVVAWEGRLGSVAVRLPATAANASIAADLTLEGGEQRGWGWRGAELPVREVAEVERTPYVLKRLPLPGRLPWGYHRLSLELPGRTAECLVIAAPRRAYAPPQGPQEAIAKLPQGFLLSGETSLAKEVSPEQRGSLGKSLPQLQGRGWGVFLPLYALYTRRSWGAGDLTDLGSLMEWVAGLGGRVVATLPLLSTFLDEPCQPSPFAPVSRLLWNELYVDVTRAPELPCCPTAQAMLESSGFQEALASLRTTPQVDYRRLMALKRRGLEELSRCCFAPGSPSLAEIHRFAHEHPVVEDYARFRAVMERQHAPWPAWPSPQREGVLRPGDYDENARRYHLYVQWLAHQQLQALSQKGREKGMRLYFDLPLGVHPDGYDAWRERELFVRGVSAGAPPDTFFAKGQDWGLPPLHPQRLRQQGYRYYIACLRHLLPHAGILRIDHVMGFHRLFWVAHGLPATQGMYVRYKAEEFYAILALESRRHSAIIVGEDLGTVPPQVRPAMARHGLQRSYVAQYSVAPHTTQPLAPVEASMVASLNTHDMPTFAAFYEGLDILDREDLGLLDEDAAWEEFKGRQEVKETLVGFLRHGGWLGGDDTPGPQAVLTGLLTFLSHSPASTLLVNLEDLWLEARPQNVPGTAEERPNWRRKATHPLEAFSRLPEVIEVLREVDRRRKGSLS